MDQDDEDQLPPINNPADLGAGDFDDHHWRQMIAAQYTASVVNKNRLKVCLQLHALLSFMMIAKLIPYMLDVFDVFILKVEELEIPEPDPWEFMWLLSFLGCLVCSNALKTNSIRSMRYFIAVTILWGYIPLIYGLWVWYQDFLLCFRYPLEILKDMIAIIRLMGMPNGLVWYFFILIAAQVHSFSMYYAIKLIQAWRARGVQPHIVG